MLAIYHENCPDGISAMWSFLKKYPNATFLGCSPGCKNINVDWDGFNTVYFLDLCPNENLLRFLLSIDIKIHILDHHKTNQLLLENFNNDNLIKVFDMKRSGCQITWDYFFPDQPRPKFLDYVADRDLWLWELEDSKDINAGMNMIGYDNLDRYENWNDVKDELKAIGEAFNIYKNRKIDDISKYAKKMYYKNRDSLLCVFCSDYEIVSDLGNSICTKNPDIDFAVIVTNYSISNRTVSLSLRSNGYDVSEIAKRYGGGGHQKAAGCTVSIHQFEKDFKSKIRTGLFGYFNFF